MRAQEADTLLEVQILVADTVTDNRQKFSAGQPIQKIDNKYKALYETLSLAHLLAQQSPVFVKSFGINGVATMSVRGASAAQSTVLWQGVPIVNPAMGVADISLLNTGLFDDISLQYGGSSALFGSGNVGGALLLTQNTPEFQPRRELLMSTTAGSFGRFDGSVKALLETGRWKVKAHAFMQTARNNFVFFDNSTATWQKMSNAALQAEGALFSAEYNLRRKPAVLHEYISLQLWYQRYQREIPRALFEAFSEKKQTDLSLRSLLRWERSTRRSTWYAKASYSQERLQYRDGIALPDNDNTIHQYYQEAGWRYSLNPKAGARTAQQLLTYIPVIYSTAAGRNLSSGKDQTLPAVVLAYAVQNNAAGWKANVALRQEWLQGRSVPILPGAGAEWTLWRHTRSLQRLQFLLRANVQRSYRIPTLNELYYFPGGNPDLKPEQGWNLDGGYTFIYRRLNALEDGNRFRLKHELSLFNRYIKDWIYWIGGAIWTPHNIAEVYSRGIEADQEAAYSIGAVVLHASLRYAYVRSTSEASYVPGDGSNGKQIPYAPRYNGQANIGLTYRHLVFNYNHTYTGYRFVTIDESQFLAPYQTGNVQLSYTVSRGYYSARINMQLQNAWNRRYEVVNARPMPGRHLIISMHLGFAR